MAGWGGIGWGLGPWGLGLTITSVSPTVIPDEGGVVVTIEGGFVPNVRAEVQIGGAVCPLPAELGGVDTSAGAIPGSGPNPVASAEATSVRAVVPQLPVGGPYDVTLWQPGGAALLLPAAVTVVRRDFWTLLHSLRRKFPSAVRSYKAAGARRLQNESYDDPATAGEVVPLLEGLLHAISAAHMETAGHIYTRLVPAPFAAGSHATVSTTNPADAGRTVTVRGVDAATGDVASESLVLAWPGPVVGTKFWTSVASASLDGFCVGTVTVSDGLATPPERIDILPGRLAKAAGALHRGDTTVVVEGNYRFPSSGYLALSRGRVWYTSKTTGAEVNYFSTDPVPEDEDLGGTVADASQNRSSFDLCRRMLLPDYAEGEYLDAVAQRCGGILRPGRVSDEAFRAFFKAASYGPRGTIYILEMVLNALVGSGHYEIIEDLVNYTESMGGDGFVTRTGGLPLLGWPCKVWVKIDPILGMGSEWRYRTWLQSGVPLDRTGALTVDLPVSPLTVYGVYDHDNPRRDPLTFSSNFFNALNVDAVCNPGGADLDIIQSVAAAFVPGDVGKPIIIRGAANLRNNGAWTIEAIPLANQVQVAGKTWTDGYIDPMALTTFQLPATLPWSSGRFGPQDVGKRIQVNFGAGWVTRDIIAYTDPRTVEVGVAWLDSGTDLTWRLYPNFVTEAALTWELPRGTVAGVTVTCPRVLPVHAGADNDVYVDFSTKPSAQDLRGTDKSNSPLGKYHPIYLRDPNAWLTEVLDDLTVAGVTAIIGEPP